MTASRVLLTLLTVVGIGLAILWLRPQVQIDDCLDRGGRWDYELSICEGIQPSSVLRPLSSEPLADIHLLNATEVPVGYAFGDSDIESLRWVEPGSGTEVPSTWASMIFIDRGIPGTDPLHFVVEPTTTDPDDQLLVLSGYSIYVIDAPRWPDSAPVAEEEVARLSTRRILPLD